MRINGFVETLMPQQVGGWACDHDNYDLRFEIAVALKGEVVAQTVANLARPDLKRAGYGSGEFGFIARFPVVLSYADLDDVEIYVIGPDGERKPLDHLKERTAFKAKQQDTSSRPVFILGSRRSGTSAVTHALLRHTRYRGPYEGHVFDLLAPLRAAVKSFYKYKGDLINNPKMITMVGEVSPEYFESALADIFRQLAEKIFAVPLWLDKTPTPEMIRAAPSVARIWPEARFIFMRRRAYENLESHRRKFPEETFENHCTWWSSCMTAWLDVRGELGGRAIEIDQYLLAHDPALAASLIAETLSLEPDEQKNIAEFLTRGRPERTATDLNRIETGPAENWSEEQTQFFNQTCLPLFAPFLYAENADYFVSGDKSRAWRKI
jgi:hypothetical protein